MTGTQDLTADGNVLLDAADRWRGVFLAFYVASAVP